GASTGRHEARERRDGGERYGGRGVAQAVRAVGEVLAPAVTGVSAADQEAVDRALRDADGTADLARLGANAVLAVSVAAAGAAAQARDVPLWRHLAGERVAGPLLPLPMVNVVSGGAHARGAGVDLQDVLVVPVGASSFAEAIEWAWRVRRAAETLAAAGGQPAALVADEGGLGLGLPSNRAALGLVSDAIERAGLAPGDQAALAVDVAATQLWDGSGYRLATEGRVVDAGALLDEIESWAESFPVVSLEDPLAEDDWEGWAEATRRLGRLQLVGDDLVVTRVERLERGVGAGIANAILVKPNQCGTLSDAAAALERARAAGYATVVSARSGDTEDCWLADLAVGWLAGQIKVGSTTRSERTAKWNRLLRIEAEAGPAARFAGKTALAPLARA
ncbi:MAG TPA: phosphopyruvate hydratase, partial [Planctomycetota bacterium]|nr:phosphopyruvate hydratase [Planctomycetota bacterium]